MTKPTVQVGTTQHFVLARGFTRLGNQDALLGADGTRRLFAELFADPDRPDVRPQEACQTILSSMQPGWTLRLLQIFWPDPAPRLAFQHQVQGWQKPASDGLDILHQGLLLSTEQYPLPYTRRTILEFVLPGDEGLAWWEGLGGLCAQFGVRVGPLSAADIHQLAGRIFNPSLD